MGNKDTLLYILIVLIIIFVAYWAYQRCYLNKILPAKWEPKICKL